MKNKPALKGSKIFIDNDYPKEILEQKFLLRQQKRESLNNQAQATTKRLRSKEDDSDLSNKYKIVKECTNERSQPTTSHTFTQ
jgi:hypothetical protein